MTFEEIKQGEETYIMHTYGRFPIALDHGKGATLWDTEGKKYIDLTSGIGVNSLGHDNEALTTAVSEQAHKLMHACNRNGKNLFCKLRCGSQRGHDQAGKKVFL